MKLWYRVRKGHFSLNLCETSKKDSRPARNIIRGCLIAKSNRHIVVTQRGHVQCAVKAHQACGDDALAPRGICRNGDLSFEIICFIRCI